MLQPFDWEPVFLSLKVASAALVVVFITGTLVAFAMSGRRSIVKDIAEAFCLLPLVLPPVVTGYALLVLAGKQGPLGIWLHESFGARLIFTPYAAVLAATIVAFPLMYQSAKAAFMGVDPLLQDAARALGATTPRVFFTVLAPLAWPGLVAGAVLSFARALGEFGATIMVAGNIAGQTTTMPTAIYMAAEGGDLRLAGIYSLLLGVFNLVFMLVLGIWMRRVSYRYP
jgi:molybdate transport system permease protein